MTKNDINKNVRKYWNKKDYIYQFETKEDLTLNSNYVV